ncbi:MAG: hypothetical protein LBT37_09075 [Lactobacillaceae bacterium]|jgi:hypothetical protein|nr:hypothetical protein [Lactobacillaceae bacterium]
MNKKKIITLVAVASLLAPSSTILADTYNTGSWSSGDDGATEVSVAIDPTYEVTIPESLVLPTQTGYTNDPNNIEIQSGATIPKGDVISISLASGQTFSATYSDSSTSVPYKIKINENAGIANSTGAAVTVLTADADKAHDEGATATMNVGFDTQPDFKYSGTYTDSVQFEISAGTPAPTPSSINIGGVPFNFVKEENGRYLVVQAGNAGLGAYTNEATYVPYANSLIKNNIDSWFNTRFTEYSNDGTAETITLGAYTIYKTTLNGATSNDLGSTSNFADSNFQNGYLSTPNGGAGTNSISAYAFVVSKADLNAQTVAVGGNTPESIHAANNGSGGQYTWSRSPGRSTTSAMGLNEVGDIRSVARDTSISCVRAAFWISIN